MIIAIDGPAASGKTTIASMISDRLGYLRLDTGAMYRSVAYVCHSMCIPYDDVEAVTHIAEVTSISFDTCDGKQYVFANEKDVTDAIRTPEIDHGSSVVSAIPSVRAALSRKQYGILHDGRNWVAEGRDIGTIVCPDADVKVFLTADDVMRAKRRYAQRNGIGIDGVTDEDVIDEASEMRKRDERDSTRGIAPLKPAEDAHIIDTSAMTLDEAYDAIVSYVG